MTRNEALAWIRKHIKYEWNYNIVPVKISGDRIVDGFFICTEKPWKGQLGFTYQKGYDNSQISESELDDDDIFKIEKGVTEWIMNTKK